MKVIPPGSKVILDGAIEAIIDQVCIKPGGYVSYGCSWWAGRNYETSWFYPSQVSQTGIRKAALIGFQKGSNA